MATSTVAVTNSAALKTLADTYTRALTAFWAAQSDAELKQLIAPLNAAARELAAALTNDPRPDAKVVVQALRTMIDDLEQLAPLPRTTDPHPTGSDAYHRLRDDINDQGTGCFGFLGNLGLWAPPS